MSRIDWSGKRILMISFTSFMQKFYQTLPQEIARQSGAEVHVLVPPHWKELWSGKAVPLETREDAQFKTHIDKIWFTGNLHFAVFRSRLRQVLRELQPDIIDMENEPFNLGAYQLARQRKRIVPHAKLVLHASQHQFKRYPPPFNLTEKYVLNHADAILARNRAAVEVLQRKGYNGVLEVVTHGVDTDAFAPRDASELRREISPNGLPIVGYVGAFAEHKGLHVLVEAMRGLPAVLLLVGDGEEKSRLVEQAAQAGVMLVVRPPAKHHQVAQLMNAMDVFALPSLTRPNWVEKFGRVIIEAMASGTPVVGSDSGEIPNVIGEAGLVFPEGDAAALRRQIQKLLDDDTLRLKLRETGLIRVQQRYSWKAVAGKTLEIYQQLLEEK